MGLFSSSASSTEEFEKHSTVKTNAAAQDLSPELLKMLEGLFKSTLSNGQFQQSGNAISSRLEQLLAQAKQPQFDVSGFAKGITDQATAGAGLQLESDINGLLSKSGTTESGNSMSALLANKMRNVTAANLSGISSQATATGEQIRQAQQGQITEGIQGLGTSLSDQILKLIGTTRGASQTGQSTSVEDTKGKSKTTSESSPSLLSSLGSIFSLFTGARGAA